MFLVPFRGAAPARTLRPLFDATLVFAFCAPRDRPARCAPDCRLNFYPVARKERRLPSVEIICVGQAEPTRFSKVPLAVEAETELRSHRTQPSLFQADFDELQGCIYHLGSPRLRQPQFRKDAAYTAADLCTEWWDYLHFKPKYVPHVQHILGALLVASPERRLLWTSDYQFGPRRKRYARPISLSSFWRRHERRQLWTNASFSITGA